MPDFNNCPTDLASMLLVCMPKSMEVRSVGLLFIKSTKIYSTFIDFIEKVLKITKIMWKNQYQEQLIRTKKKQFY